MTDSTIYRIFLASPGDVAHERDLARQVIGKVRSERRFRERLNVQVVAWDQPGVGVALEAALTPQEAIRRGLPEPKDCDLVVVILWSRIGTPLPDDYRKPDGSTYRSGTEWEYINAIEGFQANNGVPSVWIYRRRGKPTIEVDDPDFEAKRAQWIQLDSFFASLQNPDGSQSGGWNGYDDRADFQQVFESHLRDALERRLIELGVDAEPGNNRSEAAATALEQPTLELPLFPTTEATRMHFASRSIPFLGRDSDLDRLEGFLDNKSKFLWWLITGPGGSGKSRLALEFCLSHRDVWRTGFLPAETGDFDWRTWQPANPTLIVLDYAAARSGQAGQIVRSLYFRGDTLQAPVRVLLLEREIDEDGWWRRFAGDRGTRERLAVELSRFAEPLDLSPLSSAELEQVMLNLSPVFAGEDTNVRSQVLTGLSEIDGRGRPLFAAIAADAIEHGRDMRAWDEERLLADLIGRERERIWSQAGVSDQDENLLALATLGQGIPLYAVERPWGNLDLPPSENVLVKRYEAMTGKRLSGAFHPLEPDIVGEFFVLARLAREDPFGPDAVRHMWEAAYHWGDPLTFIERVIQDFPSHPTTLKLAIQCFESIALGESGNDWKLQGWFFRWAELPPAAARAGQFELVGDLMAAFGNWAERHAHTINPIYRGPYPIGLWYGGCAALTAAALAELGQGDQAFALAQRRVAFLEQIESTDEAYPRFEIISLSALLTRRDPLAESQVQWLVARLDGLALEEFKYEVEMENAAIAVLATLDVVGYHDTEVWQHWVDKLHTVTPDFWTNARQAEFRIQLLSKELGYLRYYDAEPEDLFERVQASTGFATVAEYVAEQLANLIANELSHQTESYGLKHAFMLYDELQALLESCHEALREPLQVFAGSGIVRLLVNEDLKRAVEFANSLDFPRGLLANELVRVHYAVIQQVLIGAHRQAGDQKSAIDRLRILDELVTGFPEEHHLTTVRDQVLVDMIGERAAAGEMFEALELYTERYPAVTVSTVPDEEEKRYWQMRAAAMIAEILSLAMAGGFEQALSVFNFLDRIRSQVPEVDSNNLVRLLRETIADNAMRQQHYDGVLYLLQSWADDDHTGESMQSGANWLILGSQLLSLALSLPDDSRAEAVADAIQKLVHDPNIVQMARGQLPEDSLDQFDALLETARRHAS